ncbi:MAG: hypothetical protein JKX80_00390 [Candidatus Pacebacteria bacterium]|nr:hypothetical protein [Candidatus Paceibacterota bacterium]
MYEIEIKSLLGEEVYAEAFRKKLLGQGGKLTGKNSQLNHYFQGEPSSFFKKIKDVVTESVDDLEEILTKGKKHSIRTRKKNDEVILVIKASIDSGTSENAVSRMEYESVVPLTLDELDAYLLDAGLTYQAKWSRLREEYAYDDLAITLDRNAGYGWLSEFEKVIEDEKEAEKVRMHLLDTMKRFDLQELSQDRLERMFAHYNNSWQEYYGTDKVFVVE